MKATFALAALIAATALAPASGFAADKPAAKGVKCGNSFIAAGQKCTKTAAATPAKSTAAAMAPAKTTAAMAPAKTAPTKTAMAAPTKGKGKKCGKSYIAADKTCTK